MQYGEYVLSHQDCRACRGDKLTGGVPGRLGPIGPELDLVRNGSSREIIATVRTGFDPNGYALGNPVGRMSDEELRAVYEYLISNCGTVNDHAERSRYNAGGGRLPRQLGAALLERRRAPISSGLALGLKSTVRRELHLAYG